MKNHYSSDYLLHNLMISETYHVEIRQEDTREDPSNVLKRKLVQYMTWVECQIAFLDGVKEEIESVRNDVETAVSVDLFLSFRSKYWNESKLFLQGIIRRHLPVSMIEGEILVKFARLIDIAKKPFLEVADYPARDPEQRSDWPTLQWFDVLVETLAQSIYKIEKFASKLEVVHGETRQADAAYKVKVTQHHWTYSQTDLDEIYRQITVRDKKASSCYAA